jgi:hypothetical protein
MYDEDAWGGHYAALDQLNMKEIMVPPPPIPSFDRWQTPLVGHENESVLTLHYRGHRFEIFTKGSELPNAGTGLFLRCFNDCPGRSETFVLKSGELIDLGCIGPLRKEDVKSRLEFDIKNFIFPGGPESYAFPAHPSESAVIVFDMTDDLGQVHDCAKKTILCYANENDQDKVPSLTLEYDPSGALHYMLGRRCDIWLKEQSRLLIPVGGTEIELTVRPFARACMCKQWQV